MSSRTHSHLAAMSDNNVFRQKVNLSATGIPAKKKKNNTHYIFRLENFIFYTNSSTTYFLFCKFWPHLAMLPWPNLSTAWPSKEWSYCCVGTLIPKDKCPKQWQHLALSDQFWKFLAHSPGGKACIISQPVKINRISRKKKT